MRQETGSNPNSANRKVSIQVKLGGLSFSAERRAIAMEAEEIELIIDTPRVTLAPQSEVPSDAATLLQLVGKPCHFDEQCVCSKPQNNIVAIMAINAKALAEITNRWGSRAYFTSPLADMRHSDERCLTVDATERVCYLRLFDNGLQRAEALNATTPEDTLYHISEWLGKEIAMPIYIKGSAATTKLLRKYFKRVICE